jgi:NitT/TauT family transport system permease protein
MPAVLPEIITGLRIGFALTFLGVLIGEMFASQRGLGFLIINGINQHDVRRTTAVIVIVIAAAMVSNSALLAVDRHARHGA